MRLHHKICLHNEEVNPVLVIPPPKPERLGSFLVSNSLLDNSGFEDNDDDDDDDRESKWHELLDEVSFWFLPVSVKKRAETKHFEVCWVYFPNQFNIDGNY